ncbi:MAG: metallophosphoesterase [Anaerolineae bacterium]|nr:metallophosphoesterase [Anaerolineae bacterium]
MTKILHCADLHLEASFAGQNLPPALGRQRRADLRQALARIIGLAREHRVDALTVAGDLYEADLATIETGTFLAQQFATLDPIPVFIAPGEHDRFDAESLYTMVEWPGNVHIFQPGPLVPMALVPGVALWGAAWPAELPMEELGSLMSGREGIHLLLLHAAPAAQDGQASIWADEPALQQCGFAAALLGHEHCGRVWQEGRVQCVYPGSAEALTWAEAGGEHLVALVSVDDGGCHVEKIPIGRWRYLELRVDLSGCVSTEEAAAVIGGELRRLPDPVDECTVGRVVLTGTRRFDPDLRLLRARVSTQAYLQYEVEPTESNDLALVAREPSVRGLVVRRFQEKLAALQSATERRTTQAALDLALRALDGRKVGPDADR